MQAPDRAVAAQGVVMARDDKGGAVPCPRDAGLRGLEADRSGKGQAIGFVLDDTVEIRIAAPIR